MRLFILLILVTSTFCTQAQQNLQSYTPSVLFEKGAWEFKSFQNVYTQTKSFDAFGKKAASSGGRQTWSTSINQFLYGLNNKLNVGVDVWVKNASYAEGLSESRTAIVGIGPKIKIAPFEKLKRLSIQSSYLFPMADMLEGRQGKQEVYLHNDGSLWLNQLFFDYPINDNFQLFFQQAIWTQFVRDSSRDNNYLQTQTSVFFSYFIDRRWTLYAMSEYFPTHYNDELNKTEGFYSYFLQSGLGLKFQLIPNFIEIEGLYTNFWKGSEGQGAGETINLGIRVIRQ